jgi:glycosyltransferase involved in cell wall biosynthesis
VHYPKDMPFRNSIYYRTFFKRFAKKATRIATISEYSKKDIINCYGIEAEKIDNVSCGIKDSFWPLTEAEKQAVIQKHSKGNPYFFFVGSMHPRKNIIRLIEAFDLFKQKTNSRNNLILAGNILWDDGMFEEVFKKIACREFIIFAGRVSDEELRNLLGAAEILTYVPIFEGFGLPIVEAFQAEVPVICSNVTSMPEVAGDAALQVDPFNITAIADAMELLSKNETLQKDLIRKGTVQKNKFTWKKTAALLYDSIEKTLAS